LAQVRELVKVLMQFCMPHFSDARMQDSDHQPATIDLQGFRA